MPREFYTLRQEGEIAVVELRLPEQVDSDEFDSINDALLTLLTGEGRRWVLDLAAVDHLGSAMLGLMVNLRQRVKTHRGTLVLCNLAPRLADIFRACCMERLFTIAKTRADAVRLAGG